MEEITAAYVRRLLPRRDPMGHKGTFGKVLCVCGSVGFSGAAVFAGQAAVRTGSGLVYLGVPEPVWPVAAMKCDEVMPFPCRRRRGSCPPGRGGHPAAGRGLRCGAGGLRPGAQPRCDGLVRRLLDLPRPLVLDADGINALSGHMDALSRRRDRITVLTPHEGSLSGPEAIFPSGPGAGGGGLRPGARGIPGAEGAGDHRGRPGRAADGELHRELRHGQGRQRRRAGGDAGESAGPGPAAYGRLLRRGVASRTGRGPGRPGGGLWGMTPSDLLDRIPAALREVTGKAYPKELCSFG